MRRGLRSHLLTTAVRRCEPLVFVHAGGCFGAIWAPLAARLTDYTLVLVDRPGFGLTEPVRHRPGTIRSDAVGFFGGVLDGLGIEQATFVANSMGSLRAFWLALDRPSRVSGMIHIGCPALLLDSAVPLPVRLLGRV